MSPGKLDIAVIQRHLPRSARVHAILNQRLADFGRFAEAVAAYLGND